MILLCLFEYVWAYCLIMIGSSSLGRIFTHLLCSSPVRPFIPCDSGNLLISRLFIAAFLLFVMVMQTVLCCVLLVALATFVLLSLIDILPTFLILPLEIFYLFRQSRHLFLHLSSPYHTTPLILHKIRAKLLDKLHGFTLLLPFKLNGECFFGMDELALDFLL